MDRDGRVVRTEVTALLTSMFSVLTGLRLDYHNPYVDIFVHDLFEWAAASRGEGGGEGGEKKGDWSEEVMSPEPHTGNPKTLNPKPQIMHFVPGQKP
jgi:hypothetical protein